MSYLISLGPLKWPKGRYEDIKGLFQVLVYTKIAFNQVGLHGKLNAYAEGPSSGVLD